MGVAGTFGDCNVMVCNSGCTSKKYQLFCGVFFTGNLISSVSSFLHLPSLSHEYESGKEAGAKKTPQKPQGVWILELKYNFSTNFETNELVKTSKVQKNYTFITFSTSHT